AAKVLPMINRESLMAAGKVTPQGVSGDNTITFPPGRSSWPAMPRGVATQPTISPSLFNPVAAVKKDGAVGQGPGSRALISPKQFQFPSLKNKPSVSWPQPRGALAIISPLSFRRSGPVNARAGELTMISKVSRETDDPETSNPPVTPTGCPRSSEAALRTS